MQLCPHLSPVIVLAIPRHRLIRDPDHGRDGWGWRGLWAQAQVAGGQGRSVHHVHVQNKFVGWVNMDSGCRPVFEVGGGCP